MKKRILFLFFALSCWLLTNPTPSFAQNPPSHASDRATISWVPAKSLIWPSMRDGKFFWYRLDMGARLWRTPDGQKWASVEDGLWEDKVGRLIKVGDGKLWWYQNDGRNLYEIRQWKWEAPDGKWYRFDNKWNLWVSR
ncbi:hypothetical protein ACWKWU_05095 [Chitinophaga lutea]